MMGTNRYAFERYLNVRTARDPSFSPAGRRLSFITDITGVAEVWTVPVTPASAAPSWPHQITFRGERSDSATYAPAAPVLLVAGDVGGDLASVWWTPVELGVKPPRRCSMAKHMPP